MGITSLIEFKLNWTWNGHYVLFVPGVEKDDTDSNNVIFSIKITKLYVPVATLLTKDNQNLLRLLT